MALMDEVSAVQKIGELSDESFLFKEIIWKIPINKILPNQVDNDVQSPTFSFAGATWILHIYPYGRTSTESEGWIELLIERLDDYKVPEQTVFYKFYFKTHRGKEFNPLHATYVFDDDYIGGWLLYMPKDNFFLDQKVVAVKRFLILVCEMRTQKINEIEVLSQTESVNLYSESPKEKSKEKPESPASDCEDPGTKTLQDFKGLFLKQENCDVIIKVKGQEFPAHRNILAARSPVFASTLRNDMKETATGIIEIEDCDLSCFSDFLSFLYCGNVENLSTENAFSLFTAADKYDVQDLRSKCLEFIKMNLSVDTFCSTVALALQHSEKVLIELATDFFVKNLQKIIVTVEWQSFLSEYPMQSNELLIKALVIKNEDM